MINYYEAIVIGGVCFFSRIALINFKKFGFDESGHFYFSKLSLSNCSPFQPIRMNVIEAEDYSIPLLFNYYSGLLIRSSAIRLKLFNPILESIFCMIFYLVLSYFKVQDSFLIILLYIFSPINFTSLNVGPRVLTFTPRLISELLGIGFTICILLIDNGGNEEYINLIYITAVIFGAIIINGSKFGVQFLALFSITYSILTFSLMPIAVIGSAFSLSLLFSRKYGIKMLKNQLSHLAWYFKKNMANKMAISERNSLKNVISLIKNYKKKSTPKKIFQELLIRNSYTSILIKFPVLFYIVIYYISNGFDFSGTFLELICLSGLILFIITSQRKLLFLGEAERYISNMSIIYILLLFQIISTKLVIGYLLIIYGIIYFIFDFILIRYKNRDIEQDESILNYITNFKKQKNILLSPFHIGLGVYRYMDVTDHRFLFPFGTTNKFLAKYENKFSREYPRSKWESLEELHLLLGVNIVIVDKETFESLSNFAKRIGTNWIFKEINGSSTSYVFERI